MNKEILREIGFTEGEIKVYFALFELGETTVGPISDKSKVTHAKVYPILEKLIKKGLVSHIIKDGRRNFSATDPNSLIDFVNNKQKTLEDEKIELKSMIPSLLAKQKEQEKIQYSRVFEGQRGLRTLFTELFNQGNKGDEICVLGLNEILKRTDFINFFLFYHELRQKQGISLRLILNQQLKPTIKKDYSKMFTKSDKIRYTDVIFPTGVFIFKDHVITIVADETITAFDIKSNQNSDRYKSFFNSIWDKIN